LNLNFIIVESYFMMIIIREYNIFFFLDSFKDLFLMGHNLREL